MRLQRTAAVGSPGREHRTHRRDAGNVAKNGGDVVLYPLALDTRGIVFTVLLIACGGVRAETVYVTDVLRLNLQETAAPDAKKLDTILSGDELTVLEKTRNYTRVRTRDGVTGWAKSAYLVSEAPARHQLAQLEESNRSLSGRLEALQRKFDTVQEEAARLQHIEGAASTQTAQQQEEILTLRDENQQYRERLSSYRNSVSTSVLGGAALLCLVMGFTAGIALIDYRSRKRHGGFRIY